MIRSATPRNRARANRISLVNRLRFDIMPMNSLIIDNSFSASSAVPYMPATTSSWFAISKMVSLVTSLVQINILRAFFICSTCRCAISLFSLLSLSSVVGYEETGARLMSSLCWKANSAVSSSCLSVLRWLRQLLTLFSTSFLFILGFPQKSCSILVIHLSISFSSSLILSTRSLVAFLLTSSISARAVWYALSYRISAPMRFMNGYIINNQLQTQMLSTIGIKPSPSSPDIQALVSAHRKWFGRGGGQVNENTFIVQYYFFRLEVAGSWYKMQVNQEQTPLPPSLESIEEAIIEQVLRLSLEIENSRTYCESNGLPHRYRKLIKNMKMGKSKQKCTVCMDGFQVDQPIKRLPCGHIFHSHCAKAWLRVNRRCPLCRLDLELHYQTLEMTHIQKQEASCAALS